MAAKATSSKTASSKTPSSKPAKAKPAKSPVAKPTAASKAVKAPAKAPAQSNVKAVKTPARTKDKPAATETHVATDDERVEAYCVILDSLPLLIHLGQPAPGARAAEFSSFAEAKERAIDHLIELIEEAERRLHVLRHATSREEYPH